MADPATEAALAVIDAALASLDPAPGDDPVRLLVGLSGGLDSSVLLHALVRRRGRDGIRAIHVHHGLHADADAWSAHCERACEAMGVPLQRVRVQVEASSPLGPEGAAREARHAAFAAALRQGECLVLAHHRDDQAETVLLRLMRASGSRGLAAMLPDRMFADTRMLRPLLGVPREALRTYAHAHALAWCEDPSNAAADADRNFLRLRVLPVLAERWPAAAAALATSAAQLEEDARLLDEATDDRLRSLGAGDTLPVAGLLALPDAWRARVLRRWVLDRGLPPLPASATRAITRDVLRAPHDRLASYRWRDADLRRWRGALHALRMADLAPVPPWSVAWSGREPLVLPEGGRLAFEGAKPSDLDADFGACTVGSRRGGERLRLPGRGHSHSLTQQLQAAGLPPWLRLRLPLLRSADGELLAAGGAFVSHRLQAWCDRHSLVLRWRPHAD